MYLNNFIDKSSVDKITKHKHKRSELPPQHHHLNTIQNDFIESKKPSSKNSKKHFRANSSIANYQTN